MSKLFGFYRGLVVDNDDSSLKDKHFGRLKVRVDQVYGKEVKDEDLPWAEPCLPMGGSIVDPDDDKIRHGFFSLPPKEASVWIAFEQGDVKRPIWFGTWYGTKDTKSDLSELPNEALRHSEHGVAYPEIHLIKFSHLKKGIWIRCSGDKCLELVFGDNHIKFNATRSKLTIYAEEWDVEVEANKGKIKLTTNESDIEIRSAKDILMTAGEDVRITAGGTSRIHASGTNIFSAEGAIHGQAPEASGFERHH